MSAKGEDKNGGEPAKAGGGGEESLTALMKEKNYRQSYVIMNHNKQNGKTSSVQTGVLSSADGYEVLFACGSWCYRGSVQFNGLKVVLSELPVLIAALQKQQGTLRYYCNTVSVPADSYFKKPLDFMAEAANFFASQMTSQETEDELENLARQCPWINDDSSTTYFELVLDGVPQFMEDIRLIASKIYVRGLVIISIYTEGTLYFLLAPGEGDQALLDVRFPDITRRGQGMHIASFANPHLPYTKLTLWLLLGGGGKDDVVSAKELPKLKTISVSSRNYQQTYCILKSAWEGAVPQLSVHHDVLFRFGSWCYAGRVQLIPSLSLGDLPFVIPALRMQQSRLEYLCDAGSVPITSSFAGALDFIQKHESIIEQLIEESTDTLAALIERLNRMGVGEAVSQWLEGDPKNSFFEFKMHPDEKMLASFNPVELVASKSYHASGVITTLIMYQYTIYVCISDGSKENPLLDSSFPDIAGKGRGYQIQAYADGIPEWPTLRKVSVWQTVSALEQEFNSRAALIAQGKSGTVSHSVSIGELSTVDLEATTSKDESAKLIVGGDKMTPTQTDASSSTERAVAVGGIVAVDTSPSHDLDVPLMAEEKESGPNTQGLATTSSSKSARVSEKDSADRTGVGASLSDWRDGEVKSTSSRFDRPDRNEPAGDGERLGDGDDSTPIGKGPSPLTDDMSGQFSSTRPSGRLARPHHLPKMESLSRKLEDIKKSMGDDGESAPWDTASGRPILGTSAKK